jgi:F-type H+-transporting ATPase subunit delta
MQEKATIARPYARAAFEQAREEGKLREWSALLGFLAAVVKDPLMQRVLRDPKLGEERLFGLVADLCGDRLTQTGRNFLRILVEARRLDVAPEIFQQFEEKRARAEGVSEVDVISAYEIDPSQQKQVADLMKKRLGRDVQVRASVDPSIIGGVIIRAGDSVIDASIRGRLRQLANEFAKQT